MVYSFINSNDILRKVISDSNVDNQSKFELLKKIKLSLTLNDRENEFFRKTIIPILFIDSYKLLSDRIKNGFSSVEEAQMYNFYSTIGSMDDVIDLYSRRDDYIIFSIDAVENFHRMPILGKIKHFRSLADYQQEQLSNITELHERDKLIYNMKIDEELIYNFYYYFIEELDKTDLIIDEYTIITMLSGFLQNMYLSCPDEVYETIININKTIFSKPENIGKAIEEYDKESLNMVVEDYKKNPNRFNECCLLDIQLLEDVLLFYVEMRRLGFLKGKVLKNDRNE